MNERNYRIRNEHYFTRFLFRHTIFPIYKLLPISNIIIYRVKFVIRIFIGQAR